MKEFWNKVKNAGKAVATWFRESFVPWWNRTVVTWVREKLVPWWQNKAVPWIKEKFVPGVKKACSTVWSKLKTWAAAVLPFLSKVARKVEELLGKAMGKLSDRGKSGETEEQAPERSQAQRVPRSLLMLVLSVMFIVVISALILAIALGAKALSCACRASNRGRDAVGVVTTDDPDGEYQNLPELTDDPYQPYITPAPPVNIGDTYLGGQTYSKGDSDETIAVVQQRLMDLGYMDPDEPTEHFGNMTLEAVENFQRLNGFEVTGVIDESTYARLFSDGASEFVISTGDTGDAVEEIQDRLYELGYLEKDSRTGTFGDKTFEAVVAFQKANDLDPDGFVGVITREALFSEEVIGNVFKSGDKDDAITPYQERLKELGYLDSYEEGKMDKSTVEAIKDFQDATGLVKDGVLGPGTMAELNSKEAPKYALRLGMSGSKVKDVQKRLRSLGYLSSSEVTGYFDDATEEAVKAFQKRNGLSSDGAVGSKTLSKLYDDDAKHAPAETTEKETSRTKKSTPTPKKKSTPTPKKKATPTPKKKATPTPKKGVKATKTPKAKATKTPKVKATKTPKATAKPKVTATPKPANTSSAKIERLISVAQSKLGCKYSGGAKGPDRFDCSGFVYWCLNHAGVKQSYMTSIGWRKTSRYKRNTQWGAFKRGDIMVFRGESSSTGHVGIYLGGGKMIDASSGAGQVRITSSVLSGSYWKQHFLMSYRIWE